jgi:hypothetical protein
MFCYDASMGLSQCLQLKLPDHPRVTPYLPHHENDPTLQRGLFQNEFNTTREGNEEEQMGCGSHYWNCASFPVIENGNHSEYLLVRILGQLRMAVFGWFFCIQLPCDTGRAGIEKRIGSRVTKQALDRAVIFSDILLSVKLAMYL